MMKLFKYLRHRLGFHTDECIIPVAYRKQYIIQKETCKYTMKDFKPRRKKSLYIPEKQFDKIIDSLFTDDNILKYGK
jgi:hypothetical protein